jgi:hypothetical protein
MRGVSARGNTDRRWTARECSRFVGLALSSFVGRYRPRDRVAIRPREDAPARASLALALTAE